LLTRQPGKGTFPRHGQQSQSLLKTNLGLENFGSWEVLGGGAITVELLSRRVIAANMTLAAGMGIKIGEHVTAIKRLRSTNGLPIAIDHRYMPVALVDGIEDAKFEKDAIWTVLSRDKGIEIGEATFTVRATGAAADIAEVLGVALNSPVLEYEVKVVDSRGRAVVIGSSFCHPDRFVSQTVVKGKPQVL
jgi:DNA-binding GntR family transcriptional regulator